MSDTSKFGNFVKENKFVTFVVAVLIIAVIVKLVTSKGATLWWIGILFLLCIALSLPGVSNFINDKFNDLIKLLPGGAEASTIPGTTFLLFVFAMLLM